MFVAFDPQGRRVHAWDACRQTRCVCPACRAEVVLKRGRIVVPHFAHRPAAGCAYGIGESERHHEMKWQLAEFFGRARCAFEVPFGRDRRADLVVWPPDRVPRPEAWADRVRERADPERGCVVVECQASAIEIGEWERRTRYYNGHGLPVLWVWDAGRLAADDAGECRVPAEIRHAHRCAYGSVYVLRRGGELDACHCRPVVRETYSDYYGWGSRTLKAVKTIDSCRIREAAVRVRVGSAGLRLAHFGEGVWWKRDSA